MIDDLRDAIRVRPWRSMGMALLAGASVALSRSRNPALRAIADSTFASLLAAAREALLKAPLRKEMS